MHTSYLVPTSLQPIALGQYSTTQLAKVATDSEMTELGNTISPYFLKNKDFMTSEKPENSGSPGARTLDLRIKSPLLYQLS